MEEANYFIEYNLLLPCTEASFNLKVNSLDKVKDIIKNKVS
jgi:hypothetical protein